MLYQKIYLSLLFHFGGNSKLLSYFPTHPFYRVPTVEHAATVNASQPVASQTPVLGSVIQRLADDPGLLKRQWGTQPLAKKQAESRWVKKKEKEFDVNR